MVVARRRQLAGCALGVAVLLLGLSVTPLGGTATAASAPINITGTWHVRSNDSGNAHLANFTLVITQTGTMLTGFDPVVGKLRGTIHGTKIKFTVYAASVEDGYSCQGTVAGNGQTMMGNIQDNLGGSGKFAAKKT